MSTSQRALGKTATGKTATGKLFEDFSVGQEFRHATPRTLTEAARRFRTSP